MQDEQNASLISNKNVRPLSGCVNQSITDYLPAARKDSMANKKNGVRDVSRRKSRFFMGTDKGKVRKIEEGRAKMMNFLGEMDKNHYLCARKSKMNS